MANIIDNIPRVSSSPYENSPKYLFRPSYTKNPSRKTWIFSFVPQAQHHLTEGQLHFECSENIIAAPRGTNERCYGSAVNEVAFGK